MDNDWSYIIGIIGSALFTIGLVDGVMMYWAIGIVLLIVGLDLAAKADKKTE